MTDSWGISCEIALMWMSMDLIDDKSTLVQVMAWCRQEASHYLSQCWPRSMMPCGVTRPQWVKAHMKSANTESITLYYTLGLQYIRKEYAFVFMHYLFVLFTWCIYPYYLGLLTLGQQCEYPSTHKATLKYMSEIAWYLTKPIHNTLRTIKCCWF